MRAASADALVPVAPELILMGAAPPIRSLLWGLLEVVEELSPATASVLQLLSHLYAQPGNCQISDELSHLVPRLWPFLTHSLRIVRQSTVVCMERLLTASKQQGATSWLQPILQGMLQFTFQQLLIEDDEGVQAAATRVWELILDCCNPAEVAAVAAGPCTHPAPQGFPPKRNILHNWLSLAATPAGHGLDMWGMVAALQGGDEHGKVELVPVTVLARRRAEGSAAAASSGQASKRARKGTGGAAAVTATAGAGGDVDRGSNRMINFMVGAPDKHDAVRMRMMTSKALASLCCRAAGHDSAIPTAEVVAGVVQGSATARSLSALTLWHWKAIAGQQQAAAECMGAEVIAQLTTHLACPSSCQPSLPHSGDPYSEALPLLDQLRREVLALINACMQAGWLLHTPGGLAVEQLLTDHVTSLLTTVPQVPETSPVHVARQRVQGVLGSVQTYEQYLHLSTLACCAAAFVRSRQLPPKMNLIIQPLMAAVRKEPNTELQVPGWGGSWCMGNAWFNMRLMNVSQGPVNRFVFTAPAAGSVCFSFVRAHVDLYISHALAQRQACAQRLHDGMERHSGDSLSFATSARYAAWRLVSCSYPSCPPAPTVCDRIMYI